jgi:hypothetical protein
VDDAIPTVQWTKNFMRDQGYDFDIILQKDNQSTMLLMKNGQLSAGKQTKHLDMRYFYMKVLLDRGIIAVDHHVSDKMITDFFNEPLQVWMFQVFRDIILNQ